MRHSAPAAHPRGLALISLFSVIGGGKVLLCHFLPGGTLIDGQTGNGAADQVLELPGIGAQGPAARGFRQ